MNHDPWPEENEINICKPVRHHDNWEVLGLNFSFPNLDFYALQNIKNSFSFRANIRHFLSFRGNKNVPLNSLQKISPFSVVFWKKIFFKEFTISVIEIKSLNALFC